MTSPASTQKAGEAKDAIAISLHQGLQESACFTDCACSQDAVHRNLEQSVRNASCLCFVFTKADAGEFRIRE
jgi:hypothetical protein